jgi:hypothetical protein
VRAQQPGATALKVARDGGDSAADARPRGLLHERLWRGVERLADPQQPGASEPVAERAARGVLGRAAGGVLEWQAEQFVGVDPGPGARRLEPFAARRADVQCHGQQRARLGRRAGDQVEAAGLAPAAAAARFDACRDLDAHGLAAGRSGAAPRSER